MKLIFILSTLILINSQKEKTEKQIRADACIKILKSRMNQDSEYIKHFIDFIPEIQQQPKRRTKQINFIRNAFMLR